MCVAVAAAGVLYFLFDPEATLFPRCMFLTLTGFQCPGCGSQRAIHALLHGDIPAAWHYNALLLAELPLVAVLVAMWICPGRWPRLEKALYSRGFILALLTVIIIWTVYRNL